MRSLRLLYKGRGSLLTSPPSPPPPMTHLLRPSSSVFFSPLSSSASSSTPDLLRPAATVAMTSNATVTPGLDDDVAQRKRAIRSKIRKDLKALSTAQRREEDAAIEKIVLRSSWFTSCTSICAYISSDALREVDTSRILSEILTNMVTDGNEPTKKKLYVPRVEDNNSHMRMLHISSTEDLVANSMNILEPSPIDANGNQREDVMLANDPVDIFLVPGLAFDISGRRIGRGGGYYDVFLRKYQELAAERKWKHSLLVALAYSAQIVDEDVIPVTPHDVSVDAIVSPCGVIRINAAAFERT